MSVDEYVPTPVRAGRLARLARVRHWGLALGPTGPSDLEGFDVVVVGPGEALSGTCLDAATFAAVRSGGGLLLAHVAVGPVAGDAFDRSWRDRVVRRVREVAADGWDGCYLDDLDVTTAVPGSSEALAELLACVSATAPDLLLVGQRAASLPPGLDAVGHEESLLRVLPLPSDPFPRFG